MEMDPATLDELFHRHLPEIIERYVIDGITLNNLKREVKELYRIEAT